MFNPSLKNVIFTPWMRDRALSIRRMIQWRPEPSARIDKDGDRYYLGVELQWKTPGKSYLVAGLHIHDEFQFRLAITSKNIRDNIGSTATFLSGCSTRGTAPPYEIM
ncbi:hypothetical protein D5086_015070 [Populus alba]|uniref:Uncharacterized protein n=1 Tax=Populus alba TaxID=43335 RepID=A0ACC4BZC3_POPAL